MKQDKILHIDKKSTPLFLKEWEAPILKTLSLTKTENGDSASSDESFFAFLIGGGGS